MITDESVVSFFNKMKNNNLIPSNTQFKSWKSEKKYVVIIYELSGRWQRYRVNKDFIIMSIRKYKINKILDK